MKRYLHHSILGLLLLSSCLGEGDAPLGEYETFVRYYGNGADEVAVQVKELTDGNLALLSNTELSANRFRLNLTITDRFGHEIKSRKYTSPADKNFRANSFIIKNDGSFIITGEEIINEISYLMLLEISNSGAEVRSVTLNPHPPAINTLASVKGTGIYWGSGNQLLVLSNISNNGAENMLLQSFNADWTAAWSRTYGSDDGSWLSPSGASSLTKKLYNHNNIMIWGGTKSGNNQADLRLTATKQNAQNTEFDLTIGTPTNNEEAFDMCRYPIANDNPESILGFVIVGRSAPEGGTSNIKLVRTSTNGAVIFEKTFGTERNDFGKAVTAASDGNLLVFATSQTAAGNTSYYLVKVDSNGESVWDRLIGSTHNEDAVDIIEGNDGSIIVCGTTNFGGQKMAMLMKLDKEGNLF
jgi:hypothetical protein